MKRTVPEKADAECRAGIGPGATSRTPRSPRTASAPAASAPPATVGRRTR